MTIAQDERGSRRRPAVVEAGADAQHPPHPAQRRPLLAWLPAAPVGLGQAGALVGAGDTAIGLDHAH